MSCLLILVSIALAITFSNHSSEAANLPLTITDIVLCNNNNILRSGSSGKLECRFRRSKLILGQETKGHHGESHVLCLEHKRCSRNEKNQILFALKKHPGRKSKRILKQIRKAKHVQFQYKKQNIRDKKFFSPHPWFLPPNPFAPPRSIFPPNPFAPPPSIFPPNPFKPPSPSIFLPNPFHRPPPPRFPPLFPQPPHAPPPSIFPPIFHQPPPSPPPSFFHQTHLSLVLLSFLQLLLHRFPSYISSTSYCTSSISSIVFPPNPFKPRPPQLPPAPPPSLVLLSFLQLLLHRFPSYISSTSYCTSSISSIVFPPNPFQPRPPQLPPAPPPSFFPPIFPPPPTVPVPSPPSFFPPNPFKPRPPPLPSTPPPRSLFPPLPPIFPGLHPPPPPPPPPPPSSHFIFPIPPFPFFPPPRNPGPPPTPTFSANKQHT
ncbi:hypothetical protein Bca52824_046340 [Brassica carinata]|uniref:Uncharacterized protein n=1 Tax=Brassica carinata TaxID=52824 RepID=A0A8X7RE79_BRACI|nr:hypothetical protein Bca52824_046340 [Brassica carinata]